MTSLVTVERLYRKLQEKGFGVEVEEIKNNCLNVLWAVPEGKYTSISKEDKDAHVALIFEELIRFCESKKLIWQDIIKRTEN